MNLKALKWRACRSVVKVAERGAVALEGETSKKGTVFTAMEAVLGRSVETVRGEGTRTRDFKGKQKQQKRRADGELPKRRERKRVKEMVTVIKVSWTEVVICCVPQRSRLCHQDRGVCKRLCKGAHIHMYHGHTCHL